MFSGSVDLRLPPKDIEQLFRRMVFNLIFANIDDHLKNISFIYNTVKDRWNLAPAYDLTYPLDALMNYTRVSRAMSINGKRNAITKKDLLEIADQFTVKNPNAIIDSVHSATQLFRSFSEKQSIPKKVIDKIESQFIHL